MGALLPIFSLPWWGYIVVTLVLTHVTIIAVTIYLHRHQAHRALLLHPIASQFFRFWLWLTTGMVTKEWAAIHRKHHAKCETKEDPHSPQVALRTLKGRWNRGVFMAKWVFWKGVRSYVRESHIVETLERYGSNTPNDWVEQKIYSRFTKLGALLLLPAINLMLFGWAGIAIWAVQMIWIPVFAAGIINGVGHVWGYRSFASFHRATKEEDASRNIVPWGILIGGEELHNNHHWVETCAKLSVKWYELDIGWMYIRLLEMAGLASNVKRSQLRV